MPAKHNFGSSAGQTSHLSPNKCQFRLCFEIFSSLAKLLNIVKTQAFLSTLLQVTGYKEVQDLLAIELSHLYWLGQDIFIGPWA